LDLLLRIAKIPRSSYYYHQKHFSEKDRHADVRVEIRRICQEHKGRYGYRRVILTLYQLGYRTNHKLVMKLMAEEHLTCLLRKKKYRSYRGEVGRVAPNLLKRNFKATQPNQKWATDITEFKLFGQKLYLSPILDLFNGEIVSYAVSEHPTYPIVGEMLDKAFQTIPDKAPLILHSDQGWHYRMPLYQKALREKGIRQSMSRKGNCYDNSVIENFFGVLKTEFYNNQSFTSIEDFKNELAKYIEYYNHRRIRGKLKGLSPVQFRTQSNVST
jgi:putative transposase